MFKYLSVLLEESGWIWIEYARSHIILAAGGIIIAFPFEIKPSS